MSPKMHPSHSIALVAALLLAACADDVAGTGTDGDSEGDDSTSAMTTLPPPTTMPPDGGDDGDDSTTAVADDTTDESGEDDLTTGEPTCGDGVVEGDEVCDGRDLAGQTCADEGFDAGALACLPDCTGFDTRGCFDTECGNDVQEGDEVCDGRDLAGSSCEDRGFSGGTLACMRDCSGFDTSGCEQCGNDIVEGDELCDGDGPFGVTCGSLGYAGGNVGCSDACDAVDPSGCIEFAGDCCEAQMSPGCSDPACTVAVCAIDSFCCDSQWDGICVGEAQGLCETCGGGAGDCCSDTGEVGCDSAQCVAVICGPGGLDATCCTEEWTEECAALATDECATCLPEGTCGNDEIDDEDEECDLTDLGGETCVSQGFDGGPLFCDFDCELDTSACVDFGGPCCAPDGTPGCDDNECTQDVCAAVPGCCMFGWDQLCANVASVFCDVCNTPDICGNGVVDGEDEACDPPDFDGASCTSLGYDFGQLGCDACEIDESSCGDFGGPCCAPNPTPGCSDEDCVEVVCAFEPFCCDVGWDPFCADVAQDMCEICNTPDICGNGTLEEDEDEVCDGADVGDETCLTQGFDGGVLLCNEECTDYDTEACVDFEGDCCEAHPSPGCEDTTCTGQVCAADAFCCDVEWDGLCSDTANVICEVCGAEAGVCGNFLVDDEDEACDGPDLDDATCLTEGFDGGFISCLEDCSALDLSGCADFDGDCCNAHAGIGCENAECSDLVCTEDPFCCDGAWDPFCAGMADELCAVCQFEGDCCDPDGNGTPNCEDFGCSEQVCETDETCCTDEWTDECAAIAADECAVCGDPLGAGDCCAADATPGCGTSLQCQFDVCQVDATCCSGAWDADCADAAETECAGLCGQANDCAEEDLGTDDTTSGTTVGAGDEAVGSCGAADPGPEWIVEYTATVSGTYVFDTIGSAYDTVLYALSECDGDELACNDDTIGLQSQITLDLADGETVLIVVGGFAGGSGAFILNVTAP